MTATTTFVTCKHIMRSESGIPLHTKPTSKPFFLFPKKLNCWNNVSYCVKSSNRTIYRECMVQYPLLIGSSLCSPALFSHQCRRVNHVIIYYLYVELPLFLSSSLFHYFILSSASLTSWASCEVGNKMSLFCKVSNRHLSRRSKQHFLISIYFYLLGLWHAASSNSGLSVHPNRAIWVSKLKQTRRVHTVSFSYTGVKMVQLLTMTVETGFFWTLFLEGLYK